MKSLLSAKSLLRVYIMEIRLSISSKRSHFRLVSSDPGSTISIAKNVVNASATRCMTSNGQISISAKRTKSSNRLESRELWVPFRCLPFLLPLLCDAFDLPLSALNNARAVVTSLKHFKNIEQIIKL